MECHVARNAPSKFNAWETLGNAEAEAGLATMRSAGFKNSSSSKQQAEQGCSCSSSGCGDGGGSGSNNNNNYTTSPLDAEAGLTVMRSAGLRRLSR